MSPILSIITNISFDHIQFLGNTLPAIAKEKAGIIKPGTPVVIGETGENRDVKTVFLEKSLEMQSPIYFADELNHPHRKTQLKGYCQEKNTQTILTALDILKEKLNISQESIDKGFLNVCELTGLMGRWQILNISPLTICDTGHNVGGWEYLARQLESTPGTLHIVIGMVGDKDVNKVVSMLPKRGKYYFTQASVARAMSVEQFTEIARKNGLEGVSFSNVNEAYNAAMKDASTNDTIFIGGSTFIVADLLENII